MSNNVHGTRCHWPAQINIIVFLIKWPSGIHKRHSLAYYLQNTVHKLLHAIFPNPYICNHRHCTTSLKAEMKDQGNSAGIMDVEHQASAPSHQPGLCPGGGDDSASTSAAAYESLPLKQGLQKLLITDGFIWDWIWATIFIIINFIVPTEAIQPLNRFYLPDDATLSFPALQGSTVPSSALYILTFLWPAAVYTVVAIMQRSWVDW